VMASGRSVGRAIWRCENTKHLLKQYRMYLLDSHTSHYHHMRGTPWQEFTSCVTRSAYCSCTRFGDVTLHALITNCRSKPKYLGKHARYLYLQLELLRIFLFVSFFFSREEGKSRCLMLEA
jgi:hypothetical protein